MGLDGSDRDVELCGNRRVRKSLLHEREDLCFAGGDAKPRNYRRARDLRGARRASGRGTQRDSENGTASLSHTCSYRLSV